MSETRIAFRYAKSLIYLSIEQGKIEDAYKDMKVVAEICSQSRELSVLLKSPVVKAGNKGRILADIFGKHISKLSLSFIEIIVKKRREQYLAEIADQFQSQYKEYKKIITATVTTASGLDDKLREEISRLVRNSTKSEVELIEKVDKTIIGGLIIRIGDRQTDASIQRKLSDIRKEFNKKQSTTDLN